MTPSTKMQVKSKMFMEMMLPFLILAVLGAIALYFVLG